jgi:hypothetical protein
LAVLLPNGTIYNAGPVTGAASAHAALSDASNASYITLAPEFSASVFDTLGYTKTAGSAIKYVRAIVKASSISVNPVKIRWGFIHAGLVYGETSNLQISGTTATTYNGPWTNVGDLSQASIDALQVFVDAQPLWTSARFYEASLEVLEATPPTTAVTSPTGALTASTFTIAWTHTPGTEGGPQAAYQFKVFTQAQYESVGFSADTSSAQYDSGQTVGTASSVPGVLGAGTFRIYVRTAQYVNGTYQWAAWDYEAITISLTTSEVDAVTPAGDGTLGAIEIIVDIDSATDTADHVELERTADSDALAAIGIDGDFESGGNGFSFIGSIPNADVPAGFHIGLGGGGSPTTPTSDIQNAPSPWDGNYWLLGGTFDAADRLTGNPDTLIAVSPGEVVTVGAMLHMGLGANCVAKLGISFLDDADELVAGGTEVDFPTLSAWRHYSHSITVPDGARQALGTVSIFGAPGAAGAACVLAVDKFRMSVGVDWEAVPNATDATVTSDQATILDYLVEPDVEYRYRARAVKSDGTVGYWVHSLEPVSWTSTNWFLKHPDDPSKSMSFACLEERPTLEQERPTGVFVISGADKPMVLYDEAQAPTGELVFPTETAAEAASLRELLEDAGVLYAQFPAIFDVASMWVAIPRWRPEFESQVVEDYYRIWTLPFIETRAP